MPMETDHSGYITDKIGLLLRQ